MIKKILFLCWACVTASVSYAQSPEGYHPIAKEGKVWNYEAVFEESGNSFPFSLLIHGDTTINGIAYKKVYYRQSGFSMNVAALREESIRAYFIRYDDNIEHLFYAHDLDAQEVIYDTIPDENYDYRSVDTVSTDGIPLKRIHWRYSRRYHPFKTDAYYNWIEGVGPDRNFILPIPFTFKRTGNKFISCYDQGERIYHIGEELESSSVINLPLKHEFKAGYEDSVSPDSVWIEYASNNVITLFIVGAKSDYQFRIEDHSSVPPISSSFNKHQSNCCLSFGHMCNGMNSVTIENEYESFTTSFLYPFDLYTSITSPSDKSVNCKSVNSKWSALSGCRLPTLPTQKGIYIKDGRKVLIK